MRFTDLISFKNKSSLGEKANEITALTTSKAEKTYVDAQIQNMSNQVQGFYATLTDLNTAFPTGNSNNYVVNADSLIYRWDGSQWSSTGFSFNSNVADGTITVEKTDFFYRKNILNPTECVLDKYMQSSVYPETTLNDLTDTVNYLQSKIFACVPGEQYSINYYFASTSTRVYFAKQDGIRYGVSTNYIALSRNADGVSPTSFTIPADAYYFRIQTTYNTRTDWATKFMLCKGNTVPNAFASYDSFFLQSDLRVDITNDLEDIYNKIDIDGTQKLFIPSNIFLKSDDVREIGVDNIMTAQNLYNYYIKSSSVWYDRWRKIKVQETTRTEAMSVYNSETGTMLVNGTFHITRVDYTTKANPTSQKNVLLIGDSYSDAGYIPCDIKRQLVNVMGFNNINFVGTKSDTLTIEGTEVTCLNEGRGGYTLNDFLKTYNTDGRGTSYPNPFLSGGVVSIANYMTTNAFGNLDYCIIELGVNNIVVGDQVGTSTTELRVAKAQALIDLIHSEYPSCEILLVGVVLASDINGKLDPVYHNTRALSLNEGYQNLCLGASYSEFCTYVDVAMLWDREHAFPYEMIAVRRGTTETYKYQTDWLHPSEAGYYMMTDCIVPAFVNLLDNV